MASVVTFVVVALFGVAVIIVAGDITAVGIVMVIVVAFIIITIDVGICGIAVMIDVSVIVSRGTWGEVLGEGRSRINSLYKLSNLDKKSGMGSGSSITGESLLAALEAAVREAFLSSLVLRVETPNECAKWRKSM